jgi:acetyl-CoA C-acetyltransferase
VSVIVAGVNAADGLRTGVHETEAAVRRAADLDAVYFGDVEQAGIGPNPARLAAGSGGVPMPVPATYDQESLAPRLRSPLRN